MSAVWRGRFCKPNQAMGRRGRSQGRLWLPILRDEPERRQQSEEAIRVLVCESRLNVVYRCPCRPGSGVTEPVVKRGDSRNGHHSIQRRRETSRPYQTHFRIERQSNLQGCFRSRGAAWSVRCGVASLITRSRTTSEGYRCFFHCPIVGTRSSVLNRRKKGCESPHRK